MPSQLLRFDAKKQAEVPGALHRPQSFSLPHRAFLLNDPTILRFLFWIFISANAALLAICARIPSL